MASAFVNKITTKINHINGINSINNINGMHAINNLLTVNWHVEKDCNYNCAFCFAHFEECNTNMTVDDGYKLISTIKNNNIFKINFVGGEPLLNKNIGEYLMYCKAIGLKTSIVTNASKMTSSWLNKYGPYVDQIGVSCDSLSNSINKDIGRGYGNHYDITLRALKRINELNQKENLNIQIKLNTVLFKYNIHENWIDFISENNINRWKIFKVLKIENENDKIYDRISITDNQFNEFIERHLILNKSEKIMFPENNDDMILSYIMVSPDGRFFCNSDNKYIYSDPILDVGFDVAMEQTGFNYDKFKKRGGEYVI